MKILTVFLAIALIAISTYGLITGNSGPFVLYIPLIAGIMFITVGITEYPKQKSSAYTYFVFSALLLMVGVYNL
ncbi:DUF3953 domain-containing protein [Planococcus sp. N028]|uniref:DUF3953 domain-containing protein n=1 Tax=Planococcus shixiaomingii TaxID=3058393 RepID=A0ABT8N2Y2_9BACL|nr:DUF3953 domain-containing protein [Planococcus sp. N028]MDN7242229.1 DUF3953 domain-containing protein [Planococcus sp. N028]